MTTTEVAVILGSLALYFLPAIVATQRRHRQRLAVSVTNLLLGWTLVGWVAAMIWACTADVETDG